MEPLIHREIIVDRATDEHRRNLLLRSLKCRNFRWDETRSEKEIWVFQVDLLVIFFLLFFSGFFSSFRAEKEEEF